MMSDSFDSSTTDNFPSVFVVMTSIVAKLRKEFRNMSDEQLSTV